MLERKHDSHKGENGRVLVIGGSEDYVGAPGLAALAALRTGADLAVVATPEKNAFALNSLSLDLITVKLPGNHLEPRHVPRLARLAEKSDVTVMGPGLGEHRGTREAVNLLCGKISKPKVIDADALTALKKIPHNCVLTPHSGEFKQSFNREPSEGEVKSRASEDQIVLLKGEVDVVSNGVDVRQNTTGNPGMTVGGTGDVLAGIVAGLIAQNVPLFDAAFLAAQINGEAGNLLLKEKGFGFIASDLLEAIPKVMEKM
jgi:NAD(P)H-hydrate epimerase